MKNLMRSVIVVLALLLPVVGFAAESKLFSRLDTDKSGSISKDELLKSDLVVVQGPNGQKQVVLRDMAKDPKAVKMSEEQKNRLFEQIDTDKNGFASRKEWSRASRDGFILLKF